MKKDSWQKAFSNIFTLYLGGCVFNGVTIVCKHTVLIATVITKRLHIVLYISIQRQ